MHGKGYRNHPLTQEQRASKTERLRVRARVELVFGLMENSMGSMEISSIGLRRASAIVGLSNLVYNMFRRIQLRAGIDGIAASCRKHYKDINN